MTSQGTDGLTGQVAHRPSFLAPLLTSGLDNSRSADSRPASVSKLLWQVMRLKRDKQSYIRGSPAEGVYTQGQ